MAENVYENLKGDTSHDNSKVAENIIQNHDFCQGLHMWHTKCCNAFVVSSEIENLEETSANITGGYAKVTGRTECWQGLEQDITSKVIPGVTYNVSATLRVLGHHGSSNVHATMKLEYRATDTKYLFVERIKASKKWDTLEGTFTLSTMPDRVVFYLEGPEPGVDLHIKSVVISRSNRTVGFENIIQNHDFCQGLHMWHANSCNAFVVSSELQNLEETSRNITGGYAKVTERTECWQGLEQDITSKVIPGVTYNVSATVRVLGHHDSSNVHATVKLEYRATDTKYLFVERIQAAKKWDTLEGTFTLSKMPDRVVFYLEGPEPGVDLHIKSVVISCSNPTSKCTPRFVMKHAQKVPSSPPSAIQNAAFGVNIIHNSELNDGTNGWFPLDNCTLSVATGSPHVLPPMAKDSLGLHEPLSGRYILTTNRTQTWMGPAQIITDKVKLFLTYQVSAWVKVGSTASGPQNVKVTLKVVNVARGVDDEWITGGEVEVSDDRWHEVGGSFRIEKQAAEVMVYIQGPGSGVDLMVRSLQISAVDRQARFRLLRKRTDKLRKRDVVLKFTGGSTLGSFAKIRQTNNSFPFGSCMSRTNINNKDFVAFFLKHFNWAVFENELKWSWTESQQGNFNYKDADDMLDWCQKNNIRTRGHCIFWDVNDTVQSWIQSLNKSDLNTAVNNRLTGLLTRYKGKFEHYDVNNEMLHGSFYQDQLGKNVRAYMFKTANKLDPSALLFVNDYHVEDGRNPRSSPEKYIEQILNLQEQGAPVGGIGIQGHIDWPVGSVVCSALDKLGALGLPIWFTELDVSSINEHIRADDLEVMLREAYAHPAVGGIVLWGFWEGFMYRKNSHLVNADGNINEAGHRYLKLKEEWMTCTHGCVDDQGQLCFRGFHGTYEVEIVSLGRTVTKTFVVDEGDSPLVISID